MTKETLSVNRSEETITFLQIFWTYFKIGLFTLGGGFAMAAILRHELVLKRGWISDYEFMSEMSTATLIPGAVAVNMAYLQGRRLRGKRGALTASFGVILPSFLIILFIALFALPYFQNPRVKAFLKGCSLAIAGQIAYAGFVFGRRYLGNIRNIAICIAGLILLLVFKVHPVLAVVSAGVLGYFLCRRRETKADISTGEGGV